MRKKAGEQGAGQDFLGRLKDSLITLGVLLGAVGACLLMRLVDSGDIYVSMLFLLAVLLVARLTSGYLYGVIAAIAGVFCVNYVFTYPYLQFNFTIAGYPISFLSMLAVSVVTSAMTTQIKEQERVRAAAERERIRGNLLRAISHDLRTPLTSILGASSVLLESGGRVDPARQKELLSEIVEDAEWLIRMVENLLSITRIEGEETRVVKRPEAAEEVVGEVVGKFVSHYPNFPIEVSAPDELLMVPMDALLIEQVLINLLENAVLHAERATHVSLAVFRHGGDAVFEVTDDGCGISRAAYSHLFEEYIGRAERGESDGTRNMGIGLSVCMSIIKAHGGRMEAENNPVGGATFRFTLPLELSKEDPS